jgi:hypothetical protein
VRNMWRNPESQNFNRHLFYSFTLNLTPAMTENFAFGDTNYLGFESKWR